MANLFQGAKHAALYAKYRPTTPQVVVDKITNYLSIKLQAPWNEALDVGCGSGQSTRILAPSFAKVTGTDISEGQLVEAKGNPLTPPNVTYRVSSAEDLPFEDNSLHLITASQCFHWFDQKKFFESAKRVLAPNGVLALYGYWIPMIKGSTEVKSNNLERLIIKFHDEDLGKYWDDRRNMIKHLYRGVEIPMKDVIREERVMVSGKTALEDYFGYLTSWSSYQKLVEIEGQESGDRLMKQIKEQILEELSLGGDSDVGSQQVQVVTQYFLLMARK